MPEADPPDYPVFNFNFVLQLDGRSVAGFSEVSGLEAETEVIEYREGAHNFAAIKLPGIHKYDRLTLRQGLIHDADFHHWVASAPQGGAERRSLRLTLADESHEEVMSWLLEGVRPTKLTVLTSNATGSGFAIDTLELRVEGLVID